MRVGAAKNTGLVVLLTLYCVLTLLPFYILVIRAFTPTLEAGRFHFWIPERPEVQMKATIGNLATVNNVNLGAFKQELGLKGYLDPRWTLSQIAERKQIDPAAIRAALAPAVRWNGLHTVLSGGYLKSLWGTVVVAGISVVVGGFLGIMTGTALAGFRRPWHLFVYNSYLLNMIVPPMMVILPQYLIITNYLGLQNSYLAIILLHIKGGALSTMVFTSYIATIPKELRESVYMDGGRHYHYFFHVILPLMGTPFAVFASISLPWFWNDLLHGLLFLSPEKYTLPAFVAAIGGSYGRNYEAVFSGVLMSLVPILLVYIVFQKMFIRSAMAGAVKG
jgi:ABC-type glycerol-3-phosphate transport system permease component